MHGHSLDKAAVCLRKATEDMARRYREWAEKKHLPPGEFFTLTENLRAAKNKLLEKIPTQLYDRVLHGTPEPHREHLIPASDDDVDALPGLDVADRGKLKSSRSRLTSHFLSHALLQVVACFSNGRWAAGSFPRKSRSPTGGANSRRRHEHRRDHR